MELLNTTLDINVKGSYSFCQWFLQGILSPNNQNDPPHAGYAIV